MAYFGNKSTTVTGKNCQKWTDNYPNYNRWLDPNLYPWKNMNHAYCRNPSASEFGPWCYTTDEKSVWEYCFYSKGTMSL